MPKVSQFGRGGLKSAQSNTFMRKPTWVEYKNLLTCQSRKTKPYMLPKITITTMSEHDHPQ